eukprot:2691967-Amphidinium_carterae.1
MWANRFASLDQEHDFDDEEWDSALSEVEAGREQVGTCSRDTGWCFGGPKQLLSSPTDVEVPRRNNSSGIVPGKTTAVFGQDGTCLDAEEVPLLVVPTAPCARRRKSRTTKKRRQRFNAQPIYDLLLAKLPDMDARDAMR